MYARRRWAVQVLYSTPLLNDDNWTGTLSSATYYCSDGNSSTTDAPARASGTPDRTSQTRDCDPVFTYCTLRYYRYVQ